MVGILFLQRCPKWWEFLFLAQKGRRLSFPNSPKVSSTFFSTQLYSQVIQNYSSSKNAAPCVGMVFLDAYSAWSLVVKTYWLNDFSACLLEPKTKLFFSTQNRRGSPCVCPPKVPQGTPVAINTMKPKNAGRLKRDRLKSESAKMRPAKIPVG